MHLLTPETDEVGEGGTEAYDEVAELGVDGEGEEDGCGEGGFPELPPSDPETNNAVGECEEDAASQ